MASKITIKRSVTAAPPAGLSFGEMAFVQGSGVTANQLYVGISGGNPVWVGAKIGTTGTWTDDAAKTSLATQFAIEERIGAKIAANTAGVATFNGATGAVTGVGSAVAGTGISVSGATGAVTITNIGVRTFNGLTGAVTGVSSFNGATGAVTYAPSLATTGATGVASFNSADFAVSGAGDVTIKAAGVGNTQLENPNITINGGLIALGATYNFKLSDFGSATSSELTGKISDPTGTGVIVLATGPTLSAPAISSNTIKNSLGTVANIPTTGAMASLGAGDTFVLLAQGQTLTNKTLTGATLTSPSLGTPTLLVGTNITGTASSFTAGSVTTNANLTGAITSVGNGTTLGSFTSAQLATALTDETGSGANVFGTSPAITTSLTTPSTSFDLLNTTATTVNFAGAGLTLNIGNASGTATFGGSVIVNGDFTVQGNTTTLNTTTLNVEDFNITMGLTLTNASQCTGAGIGIGVGTGITFAYDHSSLGWLSSVNMDLASGKVFKIANASVLSSSALGAGVTGSSLTQVGTITSGTWNSSFAAGIISNNDINASAGIVDTKLATIATAGKVSNSATTATNLNTASAIVARDGFGNFTAGTITAALTGNASTATDATNAANIAITSETSDTTCFITFVTDNSSGNRATKVNGALTYNAASGELSATLIDGGTF